MESQSKPSSKVSEGTSNGEHGATAALSSPVQLLGYLLRVLAIVLTLIAAIVMGVSKETVTDDFTDLSVTAKPSYSSAFVFFIVANSIASLYSVLSLVVSIANRSSSDNLLLPLAMADLVMVALLFSSGGAAIAFCVVAERGNSHAGWNKFCDSFGKFCGHVLGSIVLSMIASVAYVLIAMLGIIGLHKRSN